MKSAPKILLISDDQKLVEKVSSFSLVQTKYPIENSSLENGYEAFHSKGFEAVILFLGDKQKESTELIRKIVSDSPNTPVSIITEKSPSQILVEALDAGAANFILLPISEETLEALILKSLGTVSRNRNRQFNRSSLVSAKLSLELQSVAQSVPPTVEIIRALLSGFLPRKEILRMSLALDEVLRNAYEHGNLGISSAEKKIACNEGSFEKLLKDRELLALDDKKRIKVEFELSEKQFLCRITDQGKGFDWKSTQSKSSKIESSTDLEGRGVFVVQTVFDKVSYNDAGNQVILEKSIPEQ